MGNIASNDGGGASDKSAAARDVILAAGCMNPLLMCMDKHATNLKLQRLASWTLSNLVDGAFQTSSSSLHKSKSDYNSSDEIKMATLLPVLRRCLNIGDAEVLSLRVGLFLTCVTDRRLILLQLSRHHLIPRHQKVDSSLDWWNYCCIQVGELPNLLFERLVILSVPNAEATTMMTKRIRIYASHYSLWCSSVS